MLKIVKFGGITGGVGVLVAAGVIVWLQLNPPEAAVVASKGGSVVLSTAVTPTPEAKSSTDLRVASPESVGLGSQDSGSDAPKQAPGPEEFEQYEQYRDGQTALYGDMIVGKGSEAVVGSTLVVHYRGWLTDGRLFDETYSKGNPFSFKLGEHRVIPGWEQATLGMKAGGKRRLIVPPAAGYGAEGHDPIPPNSVLVFDVELVAVQ
jgi:hypothetical protein